MSAPATGSRWKSSITGKVLSNPLGASAVGFLGFVLLLAIVGPMIARYDPNEVDLAQVLHGPSWDHWLGTDGVGRDVFARLAGGAGITLAAAALACAVAVIGGVTAGLYSGYYGRWFIDGVGNWTTNIIMSVPSIVVLIAIRSGFGASVALTMTVLGIIMSPDLYRLTRALTQSIRAELYVDAAIVSGLRDLRIVFRHVLNVIRGQIILEAAIIGGIAINMQAGLDYLGLGDQSVPSWGLDLRMAFNNIYRAPSGLIPTAVAIAGTIAALGLLANALHDALEPRRAAADQRDEGTAPTAAPHRAPTVAKATEINEERPAGAASALSVQNLSVTYQGGEMRAVDGISFHVSMGEVLGIVGESGSGKTQSILSILGLLPPEASVGGTIRINIDGTMRELSPQADASFHGVRGTHLGYVPQEPIGNLDPCYTVGSQIAAPMRKLLGLNRSAAREETLALLRSVGLSDPVRVAAAYPHEISGGMAQRVLIAGAISCNPRILVADEPTTALDVTTQAEILDLLRTLKDDHALTVVMVTHNFGIVSDLCDRVIVMQTGNIVEEGDVRSVIKQPAHSYTQALLSATLGDKKPLCPILADRVAL